VLVQELDRDDRVRAQVAAEIDVGEAATPDELQDSIGAIERAVDDWRLLPPPPSPGQELPRASTAGACMTARKRAT